MNQYEIKELLDNPVDGVVEIPSGYHKIGRDETDVYSRRAGIYLSEEHSGLTIRMLGNPVFKSQETGYDNLMGDFSVFKFEGAENINIEGVFTIIGNFDEVGNHPNEQIHGIVIYNSNNIRIDDVTGRNLRGDTIKIIGSEFIHVQNSFHFDNGRSGIACHSGHNLSFGLIKGENLSDAIVDFETYTQSALTDILIDRVEYKGNGSNVSGFTPTGRNIRVNNLQLINSRADIIFADNVEIRNLNIVGTSRPLVIRRSTNVLLDGGRVEDKSNNPDSAPIWITYHNGPPKNITVRNLHLVASENQPAITSYISDNVTLEGNIFEGTYITPVVATFRFKDSFNYFRVTNNVIDGFGSELYIGFRDGSSLNTLLTDMQVRTDVNDVISDENVYDIVEAHSYYV